MVRIQNNLRHMQNKRIAIAGTTIQLDALGQASVTQEIADRLLRQRGEVWRRIKVRNPITQNEPTIEKIVESIPVIESVTEEVPEVAAVTTPKESVPDFSEYTKVQLLEYAGKKGISLDPKARKQEWIDMILKEVSK